MSEARRADGSLEDLISVGDVVVLTAFTSNRRAGVSTTAAGADDVILAQPATLTVSGPPSPATDLFVTAPRHRNALTVSGLPSPATDPGVTAVGRGKLNVLTYRGGRVDSTAECVPCAYDYTARRRRIDIRVWQLSGIGYATE